MKFTVGDRIRISTEYHWARGATGTIESPPEPAKALAADGGEPWVGHHRFVKGVRGPIEFFWVMFDEPQRDGDGDGPYRGGEIEANMIEPV